MKLDDWQQQFLDCKGDKMMCSGRQVGKSTICAKDCGDFAAKSGKKGVILMTAPQEFQAEELFIKTLMYMEENYPNLIKRGRDKPTKSEIKLKNDVIIRCKTAGITGLGLRSMTLIRLYVDECSQMPEMVWEVLDPELVTTGGDTIYLSTPFGRNGRFWDCWENKNDAYGSFTRFCVTTEEVIQNRPISESWTQHQREAGIKKIAEAKARLSKLKYAQEFGAQFVEDLMQMFKDSLIASCMTAKRPDSVNPYSTYYMGVDIGGRGGDPSVISILDISDKKHITQVESIVLFNEMTTQTERNVLHEDSHWKCKKIYLDDGGMGVGVYDHLLETEQTKRKVVAINNASRSLDRENKKLKKILKNDLYDNLLVLMERGEIKLLEDPEIFQSLKSIQLEIDEESRDLTITGNYNHIAESLIRAAWGARDKTLNIWCK